MLKDNLSADFSISVLSIHILLRFYKHYNIFLIRKLLCRITRGDMKMGNIIHLKFI